MKQNDTLNTSRSMLLAALLALAPMASVQAADQNGDTGSASETGTIGDVYDRVEEPEVRTPSDDYGRSADEGSSSYSSPGAMGPVRSDLSADDEYASEQWAAQQEDLERRIGGIGGEGTP